MIEKWKKLEAAADAAAAANEDYDDEEIKSLLYRHSKEILAVVGVADAVVQRWETPTWKDAPATADFIYRLRAALAALEGK